MTKLQWTLGLDGKKLTRKIKNIREYFERLETKIFVPDEVIDAVLDAAILFTENINIILDGSPYAAGVAAFSKALKIIKEYTPVVKGCLDFAIGKMKVKQTQKEKYIHSILYNDRKIKDSTTVLIILNRMDYYYETRGFYFRGFNRVCTGGWTLKRIVYPY